MKTLLVCSGGLDSVVLADKLASTGSLCHLVSFDYGQKHKKELGFAARCAARLEVPHDIIDIGVLGAHLSGSALTDDIDVPDGHYAHDNMAITIVPNRNAIMLTIAFGVACSQKAGAVAIATHGGDHFIYPDCRPDFMAAFGEMQKQALDGYAQIELHAPYVHLTKGDIVKDGASLGTPFEQTWSCYKGGERHCGRCGTCVERREAFHLAGVDDPTDYEDRDYWQEALKTAPDGVYSNV